MYALALGHQLVEQQQHRGRRVDRHRGGDFVERDAVEQRGHILQAVDRHADLADLALGARVVRVEPELRRQVEGHREAGLAFLQQIAVAPVALARRGEAGVLAHRPQPAAIHRRVDAAGVGVLAGVGLGRARIVGTIDRLDRHAGIGGYLSHGRLLMIRLLYKDARHYTRLTPKVIVQTYRQRTRTSTDERGRRHRFCVHLPPSTPEADTDEHGRAWTEA